MNPYLKPKVTSWGVSLTSHLPALIPLYLLILIILPAAQHFYHNLVRLVLDYSSPPALPEVFSYSQLKLTSLNLTMLTCPAWA